MATSCHRWCGALLFKWSSQRISGRPTGRRSLRGWVKHCAEGLRRLWRTWNDDSDPPTGRCFDWAATDESPSTRTNERIWQDHLFTKLWPATVSGTLTGVARRWCRSDMAMQGEQTFKQVPIRPNSKHCITRRPFGCKGSSSP